MKKGWTYLSSTINNSCNLNNHPQLTSYPPQPHIPSSQTQPSAPLPPYSIYFSSFFSFSKLVLQRNANGIRLRCTELIKCLLLNQFNLIFIQESVHLFPDYTFHVPEYKTHRKNRFVTRRGTTNRKPRRWCFYRVLVNNDLNYSLLSLSIFSLSIPVPII